MAKRAISVTLEADNLRWLHSQTALTKARGLSATLDRIVSEARLSGRVPGDAVRSVAGTIDIHPDDPALEQADPAIRSQLKASLRRPPNSRPARRASSRRRLG
jgi:hypothetical protein